MTEAVACFALAAIFAGLIPIVPRIVRLRIKVLRCLHLYSFADWHERYTDGIVLGVRVFFTGLAILGLILGVSRLA